MDMGTTAGRVADSASPPWRLDLTAKRKQENATGLGTSDFAIAARAPGLVVAPSLAQLLHSPKIDRKPGLASADKKADENPYARASTSLRTIAARRDAASVAAPPASSSNAAAANPDVPIVTVSQADLAAPSEQDPVVAPPFDDAAEPPVDEPVAPPVDGSGDPVSPDEPV